MKKFSLVSLFLISVLTGALALLWGYPQFRTGANLKLITRGKMMENRWLILPVLDSKERNVEGVSPDIRYSFCLFDLRKGGLKVKVSPWKGFQLLAVYSLNTDVVSTYFARAGSEIDVTLHQGDLKIGQGFLLLRRELVPMEKYLSTDLCGMIP